MTHIPRFPQQHTLGIDRVTGRPGGFLQELPDQPPAEELLDPSGGVHALQEIPTSLVFSDDRDPWDQQPGEPEVAWKAFMVYREAVPSQRSLINVTRLLMGKLPGEPVYANPVSQWSERFRWRERIIPYDNYMLAIEAEELKGDRMRHRREVAAIGRELRLKALTSLKHLKAIARVSITDPETGEVKIEVRSALSPNEIVKLAEAGMRLERDALDVLATNYDGSLKEADAIGLHINLYTQQRTEGELIADAEKVLATRKLQAQTIQGIAHLVVQPAEEITEER